jgi:hypothetical protein
MGPAAPWAPNELLPAGALVAAAVAAPEAGSEVEAGVACGRCSTGRGNSRRVGRHENSAGVRACYGLAAAGR